MGCDIHGWVEVNNYGHWYEYINAGHLLHRNYEMFGILFGVRNYGNFVPIAEGRGIPLDASNVVKADYERWGADVHSPSFITFDEIMSINWWERGTDLTDRVYCFRKGEVNWFSAFGWSSTLSNEDYAILDRGESIERNNIIYKRLVFTRATELSSDWELLFSMMQQLDRYVRSGDREYKTIESRNLPSTEVSPSRVRLVVWFDN